MASWQSRIFSRAIAALVRRRSWGDEQGLARRARRLLGAPPLYGRLAVFGLRVEQQSGDGVRGEWLTPRDPRPGVVFYLHGGGFVSCSLATHRPIAAALARFTRRRVFSVEYRVAPESRLPAAHDDVFAAYEWLCNSGVSPSNIALVGDSAGGNLVLSLAVRLRDLHRPAPACIVVFSPWTDLAGRSASIHTNNGRCAMFRPENMRDFAAAALGGRAADAPDVSPVYADLRGLPPVLAHVGSTELLLDDATRLCERLRDSGGECDLRIFDDVPHGWQMLAPFVPEASASLGDAAKFIDAAFRATTDSRSTVG
jgi:epsilon-lactone hydrolase